MPRHLTDRQVVDAFVAHRAATDHPGISVQSRPDEVERNRSAVHAIAGSLAIEHTSIDTIANQRRDGERFMQVVSEIESELSPKVPFCLRIVFPYHGIRTGQDWSEMKRGFRAWMANLTPALEDGWKTVRIPGVPFDVEIEKAGSATGCTPGVFFARSLPPEPDLAVRVRELIERKATKLTPHRDEGMATVLIVESDDLALMNQSKLSRAISVGFPNGLPVQIDELWYADTSVPVLPPRFTRLDP